MIKIDYIGRTNGIKDWPEVGTIAGLLDALGRWKLDPRLASDDSPRLEIRPDRLPYRSLNLAYTGKKYDFDREVEIYRSGQPLDPEHPTAIGYLGNFLHYSFAFSLTTDEPELIATLNAAIAANMEKFK